jgi:hypothetical protein
MKTAVEWLVEQMTQGDFIQLPKREWIDQAKEMEKEQIIDAYQFGDGEQYYNETFKSE